MSADLKMFKTGQIYDFAIDSDGDFVEEDGFDTSILMSLYEERRADESEVSDPLLRRGWAGNAVPIEGHPEVGSKNWLLEQSRNNDNTVNFTINYTNQCLQWMKQDGHVERVVVTAFRNFDNINREIEFIRSGDQTNTETYNLWENTGVSNG